GVHDLQVASDIDTGSAGHLAEQVDDILADALLAVFREADEKAREVLVRGETADELIRHSREGVITADSFIERILGMGGHRCQRCCDYGRSDDMANPDHGCPPLLDRCALSYGRDRPEVSPHLNRRTRISRDRAS